MLDEKRTQDADTIGVANEWYTRTDPTLTKGLETALVRASSGHVSFFKCQIIKVVDSHQTASGGKLQKAFKCGRKEICVEGNLEY